MSVKLLCKGIGARALAGALAMLAPGAAVAQTEINWWHAMTGANNELIVKLANDFNADQKDYKVVPTYKGSYIGTMNAGNWPETSRHTYGPTPPTACKCWAYRCWGPAPASSAVTMSTRAIPRPTGAPPWSRTT